VPTHPKRPREQAAIICICIAVPLKLQRNFHFFAAALSGRTVRTRNAHSRGGQNTSETEVW
jgi:hypothetical protein